MRGPNERVRIHPSQTQGGSLHGTQAHRLPGIPERHQLHARDVGRLGEGAARGGGAARGEVARPPGHAAVPRHAEEDPARRRGEAVNRGLLAGLIAGIFSANLNAETCLSPYIKQKTGPEKVMYLWTLPAGHGSDDPSGLDVSLAPPTYGNSRKRRAPRPSG